MIEFEDLPFDIVWNILSRLNCLKPAAKVCKLWLYICSSIARQRCKLLPPEILNSFIGGKMDIAVMYDWVHLHSAMELEEKVLLAERQMPYKSTTSFLHVTPFAAFHGPWLFDIKEGRAFFADIRNSKSQIHVFSLDCLQISVLPTLDVIASLTSKTIEFYSTPIDMKPYIRYLRKCNAVDETSLTGIRDFRYVCHIQLGLFSMANVFCPPRKGYNVKVYCCCMYPDFGCSRCSGTNVALLKHSKAEIVLLTIDRVDDEIVLNTITSIAMSHVLFFSVSASTLLYIDGGQYVAYEITKQKERGRIFREEFAYGGKAWAVYDFLIYSAITAREMRAYWHLTSGFSSAIAGTLPGQLVWCDFPDPKNNPLGCVHCGHLFAVATANKINVYVLSKDFLQISNSEKAKTIMYGEHHIYHVEGICMLLHLQHTEQGIRFFYMHESRAQLRWLDLILDDTELSPYWDARWPKLHAPDQCDTTKND